MQPFAQLAWHPGLYLWRSPPWRGERRPADSCLLQRGGGDLLCASFGNALAQLVVNDLDVEVDVGSDGVLRAHGVRRTFAVRKHATLATLRRDGSPRISGTEADFDDEAGEIFLGSMPGSLKALDLRRDLRMALHCPTEDTPEHDPSSWLRDGKIAGLAIELSDPEQVDEAHGFRIDLTEVVMTTVGTPADHLLVQSWHPERGLVIQKRH